MKWPKLLKKYIKEIVTFAIMITLVANIISYYKSTDLNKSNFKPKRVTLLDGTIYNIPNNKPLLLHFWATWCPICSVEASNIEYLSKKFEVLTIAVDSASKNEIENYLAKKNLTFKVVHDFNKQYSSKFHISVFPTTLIYDKNKKLVFSDVGYTSTIGLYLRMLWARFKPI